MRLELEIFVPVRTVPGLNAREHWAKRAKRVKVEREAAHMLAKLPAARIKHAATEAGDDWQKLYPLRITLTRTKPRGGDLDDDNLRGALKGVRDGIADALEIDDGDRAVARWDYAEAKANGACASSSPPLHG